MRGLEMQWINKGKKNLKKIMNSGISKEMRANLNKNKMKQKSIIQRMILMKWKIKINKNKEIQIFKEIKGISDSSKWKMIASFGTRILLKKVKKQGKLEIKVISLLLKIIVGTIVDHKLEDQDLLCKIQLAKKL